MFTGPRARGPRRKRRCANMGPCREKPAPPWQVRRASQTPSRATHTESLLAVFYLGVLCCMTVFAASTRQATPVREADAACSECHAAIFRNYISTPMANASGLAVEKLHSTTFVHAASSSEYTIGE